MKTASLKNQDRPILRFFLGLFGTVLFFLLIAAVLHPAGFPESILSSVVPALVFGIVVGILAAAFGRRPGQFITFLIGLF
jgi:hypothetical protein